MSIFYVNHPPGGDEQRVPKSWQPATYGIEERFAGLDKIMRELKYNWDTTGNSLMLIEAFRVAAGYGVYPPLWVIQGLSERFAVAFSDKESPSLDRAFGLTGKGLGKGRFVPATDRAALHARNRMFCLLVFKLEACGLTRTQAGDALSDLLARMGESEVVALPGEKHRLRQMHISGAGILKAVREAESAYAAEREIILRESASITEADRERVLSGFLSYELPPKELKRCL